MAASDTTSRIEMAAGAAEGAGADRWDGDGRTGCTDWRTDETRRPGVVMAFAVVFSTILVLCGLCGLLVACYSDGILVCGKEACEDTCGAFG